MSIQIDDVIPKIQYTAGAGQTGFNTTFPFYSDTDLKVYKRAAGSSPDDATDILVMGGGAAQYTVADAGVATGGSITLNTGATANDILTIVRDMPEARYSLYTSTNVTSEGLNADFSRDVMMNQQNELVCTELSPRYDYNAIVGATDLLIDILPAGYSWRKNAGGTKIEAFLAQAAVTPPLAQSYMTIAIAQATHTLAAGNIVYVDALGDYVISQADTAANAEVAGYVVSVTDADNFVLLLGGVITAGLALTTGSIYYLSPTVAGAITATKPTTAGQVIKPILQATSATTGIWLNYLGAII